MQHIRALHRPLAHCRHRSTGLCASAGTQSPMDPSPRDSRAGGDLGFGNRPMTTYGLCLKCGLIAVPVDDTGEQPCQVCTLAERVQELQGQLADQARITKVKQRLEAVKKEAAARKP